MRYLPIELDVQGREALVVGGGNLIASKVDRLVEAGARVTVIAPGDVDAGVRAHARGGRVALLRRAFEPADLEGKTIVFAEPGDEALSQQLFAWGSREGRLVCTLDRPEVCTFINPAVVSTPALTMSFSTAGASPGTLRRIREDLGALFADPRFGRYIDALRALRATLPRGERAARMAAAVEGFAIEARLRFPSWLGEDEARVPEAASASASASAPAPAPAPAPASAPASVPAPAPASVPASVPVPVPDKSSE
jgi:precorrin-2 dehydrogenase/sirohydrochlorin ferrochelatase